MWMVGGYNETSHHHHHHHHHQVNLDGFNGGRKLRPLIPRPPAVTSASSATTHSCNFGLYSGSHLFAGSVGGEQGFSHKNVNNKKEEVNNVNNNGGGGGQQGVMSSSRWNPTPEQLSTLEDLYRRGTRTPSTDQIQRITAQLCRYGKIEGKNVFYWFQNHKARERQKRRRRELQLLSSNHPHHDDDDDDPIIPRKERGPASGKQLCFEAEQTRSHYYASAAAEECGVMSMQRAIAEKGGRRAGAVSEHRSSRHNNTTTNSGACLFQLDNERNATWHNLAPSSTSPSFCYSPSSLIARIITTTTTTTPNTADGCATPKTRRFIASLKESNPNTTNRGVLYEDDDDEGDDSATLQLFPLRSQVDGQQEEHDQDKSKERDVHFFEFLSPKID